jgi:creatinine amidohydrolase
MAMLLAEMNAADLRVGGYDKAVLAVGATEYHGDHLPYSADTIAAETIARRIAADLGGMVALPPLAYGVSMHHRSFPWTLSIGPETLTALVLDIAASLLCHGIRKLLIVTAHDGNPAPVQNACRTLHDRHGMHVALVSGWQGRARELLVGRYAIDLDHAGQSEMSMVLHAAPHLAKPQGAMALPNEPTGLPVTVFGAYAEIAPHGYTGDPAKGSAVEGTAIVEAIAGQVVPFLRRLDANGWKPGAWMYEAGRGDK